MIDEMQRSATVVGLGVGDFPLDGASELPECTGSSGAGATRRSGSGSAATSRSQLGLSTVHLQPGYL